MITNTKYIEVVRRCRKCNVVLTDDNQFPSLKKHGSRICKKCYTEQTKKWQSNNHDRIREKARMSERKTKTLYSTSQEGMEIQIQCRPNESTGHIGINTTFTVNHGWHGGAVANPKCSIYFGVVIGEKLLSQVFDHVERMPNGNPGYDFICGQGYKIDVKLSCFKTGKYKTWAFNIRKNVIADYFLLAAFNDRHDLKPMHVWLIPGHVLNHLHSASISESTVKKWKQYRLSNKMRKVIKCCNSMR